METRGENGERVWTGTTMASKPMIVLLALVVVGAFVLIAGSSSLGFAAGYTIVVALLMVTFLYANVVIDERGVEVQLGPLGWPRVFRPATDIGSAKVRHVEWWRCGLGYRWIWRGTAVVPRSGAAVEVGMTNGKRFIFTTDDAEAAARRLNQMIEGERGRL